MGASRADNRVVLVDAGFYRDKFMQQWKPAGYSKPSDAVQAGLGIAPEDVTDVIISHIHWDHADGTDSVSTRQGLDPAR